MYNSLDNTFWICLGLDLPNAGLWSKDACDSILRTTAQLLQADGRRGHEHRSWEQHGCHESCCLLISGAHRHSDRRWSFPTWYVANKSVYKDSLLAFFGGKSILTLIVYLQFYYQGHPMSNENFVCEDYHFKITIYFVDLFLYFKISFRCSGPVKNFNFQHFIWMKINLKCYVILVLVLLLYR